MLGDFATKTTTKKYLTGCRGQEELKLFLTTEK